MKSRVYHSIYRAILLISVLYLLGFPPAMGQKKQTKETAQNQFDLAKILVRVGDFLAQYKFFERDRRKLDQEGQPLMFMERFPDPPLEDIPNMIRDECDKGVIYCLKLINQLSYKPMLRKDLFTLRVAGSYYMCWYTMHEDPLLRHFGSSCQVTHPMAEQVIDYRGWDKMPFDCALHSFCPDLCCGSYVPFVDYASDNWRGKEGLKGFSRTKKICAETKGYPCGITQLACSLDFKNNRDWEALIRNKLNTTCTCGKVGRRYEWDHILKLCVDQDECREGTYDCEPNSVCRNIESDYYCTCRLGYKFNARKKACTRDTDFAMDDVLRAQAGQYFGMTEPPKAQTGTFQWSTYFYWLIDHSSYNTAANSIDIHCTTVVISWTFAAGVNFYPSIVLYV